MNYFDEMFERFSFIERRISIGLGTSIIQAFSLKSEFLTNISAVSNDHYVLCTRSYRPSTIHVYIESFYLYDRLKYAKSFIIGM